MTYTFQFTLDQVNEIIAAMAQGPYAKVNAIIQELNRQLQAQVKQEPPHDRPSGNGSGGPRSETGGSDSGELHPPKGTQEN